MGGKITTLQTIVVFVGNSTYEIELDHRVIGFIRRIGQVFEAHAGPDITSDSEWGRWELWDKAAAFLVRASGFAPIEGCAPNVAFQATVTPATP
ncbi:hypothetical protein [Lacisediminihabitans sp.]|uniref:hypothetical protein n=1 Tax=Lacisediminihabitans sp. TaxID=2787631 RepID=UPI00374C9EDF